MRIARRLAVVVLMSAVLWAADAWVVRPDGVGPVKVGMTLAQLNTVLHEQFSLPEDKEDQGCFYVRPKGHAVAFMIEDGRLVRIDVHDPGMFAAEGVQVGDSQVHTQKVYGSKVKVQPSEYTGDEGGRYLTVVSQDGRYGLRFVTEKGKITMFYAGTSTAIQYVEGCE